jgi:hypothetical protein
VNGRYALESSRSKDVDFNNPKDRSWPKAAIGVFDISTYRIAALRV